MVISSVFCRFLAAVGVFLALSLLGPVDAVAETYRVYGVRSSDVLNIRSKPSVRGRKIGSIPPSGYGIRILGSCWSGWCPIKYRNMTGWVSKRFLVREALGSTPHRVTGIASWDVLYIRSRPSARGRKLGSIPPYGRGVSMLGPCRGNWCEINYRGIVGWASMMYLIPDTSTMRVAPRPAPTPSPNFYQPNNPQSDNTAPNTPPPADMFEGLDDPQ